MYGSKLFNIFPTDTELNDIDDKYTDIGFPGCIGAVDCMHYTWKNFPATDKGQYQNSRVSKMATIQCEGWCDHDLYCWSWFSGRPGTNNDLNVLARSPLFQNIFSEQFSLSVTDGYNINQHGMPHHLLYFLGDGIYPTWPIFAVPISSTDNPFERKYSFQQKSVRKDVERLFGVLHSRFEILRRENRRWQLGETIRISNACVILHNVIIRIRQEAQGPSEQATSDHVDCMMSTQETRMEQSATDLQRNIDDNSAQNYADDTNEADRLLIRDMRFTDQDEHYRLQSDLVACNKRLNNWA